MVRTSTITYGMVILLFCVLNTVIVFLPYSDLSDKGWELSLLPSITAVLLALSNKDKPTKTKFDVLLLVLMAGISMVVFNLPDPTLIWIMMIFIVGVYIPAFFLLLSRGAYLVWKG